MSIERPRSITSIVLGELLETITQGVIPLGALLSEKALAAQYGTSKTPVREAFVQLHAIGLVEILPQRGYRVFHPTVAEVQDLCDVRGVLEVAATRFAMERRKDEFLAALVNAQEIVIDKSKTTPAAQFNSYDDDFHNIAFQYCESQSLRDAYAVFQPRIHTLRVNLQKYDGFMIGVTVGDHSAIVDPLCAGEIEQGMSAINYHVQRVAQFYADNWDRLMAGMEK